MTIVEVPAHPLTPELTDLDVAATYLPAGPSRLVGGDWYDAYALDDDRVVLSVGDACGHGSPAAGLMAQARDSLRTLSLHGVPPADALAAVSNLVGITHPGDFATCIHAVLDVRTRHLSWARAGHPPLLHGRGSRARFLDDDGGPPLGAFPGARFGCTEIDLAPGDHLVLYTDGLVEHPPDDLATGMADLAALTARSHDRPAADLNDAIDRHLIEAAPRDDVCVLIVRLP